MPKMNETNDENGNDNGTSPAPSPETTDKKKKKDEDKEKDKDPEDASKVKVVAETNASLLLTGRAIEKANKNSENEKAKAKANSENSNPTEKKNKNDATTALGPVPAPAPAKDDDSSPPPFVSSQRFDSIDALVTAVENYSLQQGFRFAKSFTYLLNTNSRIVQRGKFKCKKSKTVCDFVISFSGKVETSSGAKHPAYYVIKNVCLKHGHPLHPPAFACCGDGSEENNDNINNNSSNIINNNNNSISNNLKMTKVKKKDLSVEEVEAIRQLSFSGGTVGKYKAKPQVLEIVQTMNEKFGANYSPTLISELQETLSQQIFGSNRDGLQKFLDFGYRIQHQDGGKFHVSHRHDLTFHAGAYQDQDMVRLHEAYSDHILQDGELLATNVFGQSLMPTLVVDGLGKPAISSVMILPTDNADDCIQVMKDLALFTAKKPAPNARTHTSPTTTYTTDRNPIFSRIAQALSLNHHVGAHNGSAHIEKNVQMEALGRNELQWECRRLLTTVQAVDAFEKTVKDLKLKYSTIPSALKHLAMIEENKTTMCKAFTGRHFTCCGTASPKTEDGHSVVKDLLTLRKEQKKQSIFETAIHLKEHYFVNYKSKALKEISSLIKKKAKWSSWVQRIWADENSKANLYSCSHTKSSDDRRTAYDVASSLDAAESVHRVTMPSSTIDASGITIPDCDCIQFTSTCIPCRHVCCAYRFAEKGTDEDDDGDVFQQDYLKPRWRLENHPFYEEAAKQLLEGTPETSGPKTSNNTQTRMAIGRAVTNGDIDVPPTVEDRHAELELLFKGIVSECTDDSSQFKMAIVAMETLNRQLQEREDLSKGKRKDKTSNAVTVDAHISKKARLTSAVSI